jgi:TolB protein
VTDQRGSIVLQKSYSGGPRLAAHRFADDIVETVTGHKGIASTRIAFASSRTGRKEIYTADYDGANVRQLTRDGTISVAPALAPDGSKLAYTGYQSGYADIYLIELASGARSRIVKFPGRIPARPSRPMAARLPALSARTAIRNFM